MFREAIVVRLPVWVKDLPIEAVEPAEIEDQRHGLDAIPRWPR